MMTDGMLKLQISKEMVPDFATANFDDFNILRFNIQDQR